ncbi:MAG: hypothetical protein WBO54_03105 [Thermoanaerobaculia bacterium]
MRKLCGLFLVMALAISTPLRSDHGDRRENPLDAGGIVISKSFKTNLIIYKSVGGETVVKGKEKKRKWWCAWLCRRRVSKDADRIEITNTYYSEISPGVFAELVREPRVCTNTDSCEQKEYAFGVGVKLKFPDGGPSPTPIDGLLPVDGVITLHVIQVDGRTIFANTGAGKHPGPIVD